MPHRLFFYLVLGATSLVLSAAAGTVDPHRVASPPAASRLAAPPRRQRLRVNDTLMLVVSRPRATFATYGHKTPTWLWQHAELRGRHGYHQVLSKDELCSLYGTWVSPRGELLCLAFWRDFDEQLPEGCPRPRQPLWLEHDKAFACPVWDVRYRTWTEFYDANFREMDPIGDDVFGFQGSAYGFTGGRYRGTGPYYLPPTWLAQEQARVRRTHRLPPAPRLAIFLALTNVKTSPLTSPAYRPLLARLLRAYAACPMPAATARQVTQARQALARAQ